MLTAQIILFALFLCARGTSGAFASDGYLAIFEGIARRHLRDESYLLGPEWRDSDGNFKEVRVLQAITNPVAQCPTGSTQTSSTSNGVTLTTQLYVGTSPLICLYMEGNLGQINMNYNPSTMKASSSNQAITTGVTCSNCYAYVGVNMQFSMSCTTSACQIGFSTGGGLALSASLALSNPSFSASQPANIVAPPQGAPNIANSAYTQLFSDAGFYIAYLPALQITAAGTGSATGSSNLGAVFQTTANLEMGIVNNAFVEGFSSNIAMQPPSITGTGLQSSALTLTLTVNATIYWSMGYVVTGTGAYVTMMTPIIATYTYGVTSQGTCTSGESLVLDSFFQSVGYELLGASTSVPLTIPFPPATISSSTGSQCLASTGLSPGDLAAAIVVPILFVGSAAGFYYYWFFVRNSGTAKSDGSTTTTEAKTAVEMPTTATTVNPLGGK